MKIYFNLDGVLAGFELYYNENYPGVDIHDREQFAINSKTFAEIEWFKKLPVLKHGMDLLMEFHDKGYEIEILSAAGNFDTEIVAEHKKEWVKQHVPFDVKVNVVNKWYDKAMFARPDTLLIDDREKGVRSFIELGGNSFLYTPDCTFNDIYEYLKQVDERKYINVFPDYCSTGLWDDDTGIMVCWDELEVKFPDDLMDNLTDQFEEWEDSYDKNINMSEEWHKCNMDIVKKLNEIQNKIVFVYKRFDITE